MPYQTGQILNERYRIVKLLGQGGFGAVYKAWDTKLNGPCAIKENFVTSQEAERQFAREASMLFNLRHPSLPRVFDHFSVPNQGQYLVMDFIEGQDLQEVLDQGMSPLSEAKVLPWIEQICDAIEYLHSQNPPIIHRDIKPANIKITPKGQAVLVDFGIAKIYDPKLKTTLGARAVTPGYSPPEQYGRGDTNPRSDIYALGATLYTALTNTIPPDSVDILTKKQAPPARTRGLNQAVSPAVESAITRAMQLEEAQRFHSAAAFKAALRVRDFTVVAPTQAAEVAFRTTALDEGISLPGSTLVKKNWYQGLPKWTPWAAAAVVVVACVLVVGIGLGTAVFSNLFKGESTDGELSTQGADSSLSGSMEDGAFGTGETQLTPLAGDLSGQGFGDKLTLLGQLGGNSYAVDVDGTLAYLGTGPRVTILDISNPSTPSYVGQSSVLPGVVRSVIASGIYAYVAAGKGYLHVLDISNPTQPYEVSSYTDNGYAQGLALDGNTLYIADNPFGLRVVDLSDPLNPKKLGELNIPGAAASVAVSNSRVYLAGSTYGAQFAVIDVSNPSEPALIGNVNVSGPQGSLVQAVHVVGNTAYVAAGVSGLVVMDVSDPSNPIRIGGYQTPWADGLAIDENALYLSDWVEGIYALDISNPANPALTCLMKVKMSGQQVPSQRNMVARSGKVFTANFNQGLTIFDFANTACPASLSRYDAPLPGAAWDVFVEGAVGYAIEDLLGMFTLDLSNPEQPRQLGSDASTISGGLRTPRAVVSKGSLAYVVDINNGFSIYDVSDPSNPQELSRVEEPQGMTDVAIAGNYAYISLEAHGSGNQNRGLLVLELSNPAQPVQVSFTQLEYGAESFAIQGDLAFYPDFIEIGESGQPSSLRVFDLSAPGSPVQVGEVDITSLAPTVFGIEVAGNYAYLGDQKYGLQIFDISDPGQPRQVDSLSQIVMVMDLVVVGDHVFTASYGSVNVIDVSDPVNPKLEDMLVTPGLSMGIYAIENTIYVADFDGGLVILSYQE